MPSEININEAFVMTTVFVLLWSNSLGDSFTDVFESYELAETVANGLAEEASVVEVSIEEKIINTQALWDLPSLAIH